MKNTKNKIFMLTLLGILFFLVKIGISLGKDSAVDVTDSMSVSTKKDGTNHVESSNTPSPFGAKSSVSKTQHENRTESTAEFTPEQIKELEGNTANQYQIRKDILKFIQTNIPADNQKAMNAAIKLAQYENKTSYHSKDQAEALMWFKKYMIALHCLALAVPEDWPNISQGIIDRMYDTPQRDKYEWGITNKYFAWQILGTGLTTEEEKKVCETENF